MTHPIFYTYQKTLLFGEQCRTEWALMDQWYHVQQLMMREPRLAAQLKENFELLAYREWKESFRKIDRFGGALWREGYE